MPDQWLVYWPYIAAIFSIGVGLVAAIHAAMTKEDVRAAIGWVGVIVLAPVIGPFIYLIVGINRIRRSSISTRRKLLESYRQSGASPRDELIPPQPEMLSLRMLGDTVSPFPLTAGNHVELLDGGDATYPAMLDAIDSAERFIVLSSYIFDNDAKGQLFIAALAEARQRGVNVRVLVDAVGARYSRPSIVAPLREADIPHALFLGQVNGLRLPYANLRNHRKIMVVDGHIGFTGGMNIREQFSSILGTKKTAHDTHFRIRGPAVGQFFTTFADDWYFTTSENLDGDEWSTPEEDGAAGTIWARAIVSGPDMRIATTHTMIMGAIAVARHHIRICSPYFLPDLPLITALGVAARRGVSVEIVVPAKSNLRLVDFAMTAQFDQMVSAGCRIYRQNGNFDHSKLMSIDGRWALIGSSNIDSRSLRLNFELDVEIFDADFATMIGWHISRRIDGAWEETPERLKGRPFWKKLRNRLVWLASPYL